MGAAELPPIPRMPTGEGGARRRTPRRRTLSIDAIVDTALAIIDAEGLDALTMRTVAHVLGTGAASLYAHVDSKDRLIELVVERVIGEVRYRGDPDPDRWMDQLKETAREIRRVFTRHGDLARASFARIPLGENALQGSEWLIRVMRAGGLGDEVIALACDLLPLYVMAVAYEDSLYVSRDLTPQEVADYMGQMREYFAALPSDRFPGVVGLAGLLTSGDHDSRFEFGLEVLLRGLVAVSEAQSG
jgi:AcrR family transcriptional regulator